MATRLTQYIIEVIVKPSSPNARLSQYVTEVLVSPIPRLRLTQQVIEVLRSIYPLYNPSVQSTLIFSQYTEVLKTFDQIDHVPRLKRINVSQISHVLSFQSTLSKRSAGIVLIPFSSFLIINQVASTIRIINLSVSSILNFNQFALPNTGFIKSVQHNLIFIQDFLIYNSKLSTYIQLNHIAAAYTTHSHQASNSLSLVSLLGLEYLLPSRLSFIHSLTNQVIRPGSLTQSIVLSQSIVPIKVAHTNFANNLSFFQSASMNPADIKHILILNHNAFYIVSNPILLNNVLTFNQSILPSINRPQHISSSFSLSQSLSLKLISVSPVATPLSFIQLLNKIERSAGWFFKRFIKDRDA